MNKIKWTAQSDLVVELGAAASQGRVDVNKAIPFLHDYIKDKADYDLPINNSNLQVYYQLIGNGSLQYAIRQIDCELAMHEVMDKNGNVIKRFVPKSSSEQPKID